MHLVNFTNIRLAQAFVDYMATKNITIRIETHPQQIALFLDDEKHSERVLQELNHFMHHPDDYRYRVASWQTGTGTSRLKSLYTSSFSSTFIAIKKVTLIVAIITVLIYCLELILGIDNLLTLLRYPYYPSDYKEIWRFFTPVFLHFSLTHLVFNLAWWIVFGNIIEEKLGYKKLLEILLFTGLISNYCEALTTSVNFGGLSGVVYGLVGYIWLTNKLAPQKGVVLNNGLLIFFILWLITGFTGYIGNIANIAHLSGLGAGLLLALKDQYLITGRKEK